MINEIKLFIFIFSILYVLGFCFDLVVRLVQENPEPIKYNKYEKLTLFLLFSYIITYIITLI